jgi:16S rRNA (adenine1518-N6/adenine1519-N6)-dimethyltransferase
MSSGTVRPRKDYGQHWLRDEAWLSRIADAASVTDQSVVEIGPGTGALTELLLLHRPKRLVAIDIDRRCLESLAPLQQRYSDRLELCLADALTVNLPEIMGEPYRLVGNLPYHVGTALVRRWIEDWSMLQSMLIMLQKEVADRLMALPGSSDYGRLSVLTQRLCTIDEIGVVPPSAFYPPPKVDSSVIYLRPRLDPVHCDVVQLETLLQVAFSQRRKMLRRTLGLLHPRAMDWMESVGIAASDRPENIAPGQWYALADTWSVQKKLDRIGG